MPGIETILKQMYVWVYHAIDRLIKGHTIPHKRVYYHARTSLQSSDIGSSQVA